MSVQIRKARKADCDALIALSRHTISAAYRPFLGAAAVAGFIDSGAADQYVRDNLASCLVILVDGAIAGYSVYKGNLIDLMMIDGERHRRGLGSRLLQHVEKTLFRRYDELILESFAANDQANHFYRKNGWRVVEKRFDATVGVDKLIFKKAKSGHPYR